jgi:hypothetical protein
MSVGLPWFARSLITWQIRGSAHTHHEVVLQLACIFSCRWRISNLFHRSLQLWLLMRHLVATVSPRRTNCEEVLQNTPGNILSSRSVQTEIKRQTGSQQCAYPIVEPGAFVCQSACLCTDVVLMCSVITECGDALWMCWCRCMYTVPDR